VLVGERGGRACEGCGDIGWSEGFMVGDKGELGVYIREGRSVTIMEDSDGER
jgi:hypothetical protein